MEKNINILSINEEIIERLLIFVAKKDKLRAVHFAREIYNVSLGDALNFVNIILEEESKK